LNQYFDREADQANLAKKGLPIASGMISPRGALTFSIFLISTCLFLVSFNDFSLLPLFLIYFGLLTAYSAPPLRLKTVPVLDLVVAGIGSGLFPFIIGLEVSHQLSADFSLPWVKKRYYDALLTAIPLFFYHSGSHVIQAIGDYEADRKMGLNTFVVKYGRKKSMIVAGSMFFIALFSLLTYFALGLFPTGYLLVLFVILPFSYPLFLFYFKLLKNPSSYRVSRLTKITRRLGPPALAIIWIYGFFIRFNLFN
jgi:4-hydroxybenzoate polyprenyltransferase